MRKGPRLGLPQGAEYYNRRGRPSEFDWAEITYFMAERYIVRGPPKTDKEFILDIQEWCEDNYKRVVLSEKARARGVRGPSRSAIQKHAVPFKRRMDDAMMRC
jgi:hypothetical protein